MPFRNWNFHKLLTYKSGSCGVLVNDTSLGSRIRKVFAACVDEMLDQLARLGFVIRNGLCQRCQGVKGVKGVRGSAIGSLAKVPASELCLVKGCILRIAHPWPALARLRPFPLNWPRRQWKMPWIGLCKARGNKLPQRGGLSPPQVR